MLSIHILKLKFWGVTPWDPQSAGGAPDSGHRLCSGPETESPIETYL